MAQDVTRVRVALSGTVWVADPGATVPADITVTPNASWTDLGFTDENGVQFTLDQQTADVNGWQSLEPLRVIVTSEPKNFTFTLRQLEHYTWTTAFGGTITGSTGNWHWTPPSSGTAITKMFLVEFTDSSLKYRLVFRNTMSQNQRQLQFNRAGAVDIPLDYRILNAAPSQTWELFTNDNNFT